MKIAEIYCHVGSGATNLALQ